MAEHCGPRHCEGPAPPEAPCGTGLPKPCMQPSSPNCISPRTGSPEPGTEPPSPTETSPRTGSPKPCTKLPSPTWISPRTGSPKPCTELRSPTDELAQTLYEAGAAPPESARGWACRRWARCTARPRARCRSPPRGPGGPAAPGQGFTRAAGLARHAAGLAHHAAGRTHAAPDADRCIGQVKRVEGMPHWRPGTPLKQGPPRASSFC